MARLILLWSCLSLCACTGEAVECLIDNDCSDGQYCVSTRCADPVPEGDYRQAYINQVAVVIETGCNCHGPESDRPWRYDHRFDDAEAFDTSLRDLKSWLYDPFPGDEARTRPTAWAYGLARCGFNHPGIYEGTEQPHYQLLDRWAVDALPQISPLPLINPAPAEPVEPDANLQAEIDAINALAYDQAMDQHIMPRIVAHCGCCHDAEGNRGWTLTRTWDATNTEPNSPYTQNKNAIEGMLQRLRPDQSPLFIYGAGGNGRQVGHPVIYSGPTDARYQLLRGWIANGAQAR